MRLTDTKDANYMLAVKENNQTHSYFKTTLILKSNLPINMKIIT